MISAMRVVHLLSFVGSLALVACGTGGGSMSSRGGARGSDGGSVSSSRDAGGAATGLCSGLRDDFAGPTLDSTRWRTIGFTGWTPEIVDGRLTYTPLAGHANTRRGLVLSAQAFNMTGCSTAVEIARPLPAGISGEVAVSLTLAAAMMVVRSGTLSFSALVDGSTKTASIPFDPAAHRWWRFREAAGVLFMETAPDGRTWTEHFQAAHGANASSVQLAINVIDNSITGVFDDPQLDNVNVAP